MLGCVFWFEGLTAEVQIAGDIWEGIAHQFGCSDIFVIDLNGVFASTFQSNNLAGLTTTVFNDWASAQAAIPGTTTKVFLEDLTYCLGLVDLQNGNGIQQRVNPAKIVPVTALPHPADCIYIPGSPTYASGELWQGNQNECWAVFDLKHHDRFSNFWTITAISAILALRKIGGT